MSLWDRVEMTVSCRDTDFIPKVPGAGSIVPHPDGSSCQLMHNGLRVLAGGYHGEWMSEIIRRLRGHHEPQEEVLFHAALPFIGSGDSAPVMVELGSFWAYYSLWFRSVYRGARNVLVEPDSDNLRIGERNFELNGFHAESVQAFVGAPNGSTDFACHFAQRARSIKTLSIDCLVRELSLDRIHLLHADIQGAELAMLHGAANIIEQGRLDWLFLSTHHHSISGDPLTHQRCLEWLHAHGAFIIDEHSVSESFSGDGLIVAAFGKEPQLVHPSISRNVPSRALFREVEYDLAEAWNEIEHLKKEILTLSGQS